MMAVASGFEIGGGLLIILAVIYDLFQSVVLPRPSIGKFSVVRSVLRSLWRPWRWWGTRTARPARRESRLAAFGPVAVLAMFALWAGALVVGYGLIYDGLSDGLRPVPESFGSSLYFSAST